MTDQCFDALRELIENTRKAADDSVLPWQAAVTVNDYFVQATPYGFLRFGRILRTEGALYESERGRNYRLCCCYSLLYPSGKFCEVHVSSISALIPRDVFLHFDAKQWVVETDDIQDVQTRIAKFLPIRRRR